MALTVILHYFHYFYISRGEVVVVGVVGVVGTTHHLPGGNEVVKVPEVVENCSVVVVFQYLDPLHYF